MTMAWYNASIFKKIYNKINILLYYRIPLIYEFVTGF